MSEAPRPRPQAVVLRYRDALLAGFVRVATSTRTDASALVAAPREDLEPPALEIAPLNEEE